MLSLPLRGLLTVTPLAGVPTHPAVYTAILKTTAFIGYLSTAVHRYLAECFRTISYGGKMGPWLIFPASEIVIASHLAANRTGSGSRPGRTLDFGAARIPGSLASGDETGSSNTNHSAKRSN